MATKARLYKIASQLGVSSETVVNRCRAAGCHEITNAQSFVPEPIRERIRQWYSGPASAADSATVQQTRRGKVFISYRRDSGASVARAVQRHLESVGFRCFLDVDALRSGWFDEVIVGELDGSCAVIAILTPGALDRCAEPGDWVREELSRAISQHKRLVPLLMPGFTFGPLPSEIASLGKCNAVEYSHTYFDAAMMRLESAVGKACKRNRQYERSDDE